MQHESIEVEYNGKKGMIETQFLHCDVCEADFVGAAEIDANALAFRNFLNSIDGNK